jgi:NADH-quinone oxidoreductase subunit N
MLSLAMISLTGIPPAAGFIAKFYIFTLAVVRGLWPLVIVGILGSAISAYYYLRVVAALYADASSEDEGFGRADTLSYIAMAICVAAILFLGLYPAPLLHFAGLATSLVNLKW